MRAVRAATLLCVIVAVVVCAWFAIGIRQAIDTSRANAIVARSNHPAASQEREVASLANGARFLNPDKQPDVLLGRVETNHGDSARARSVLEPVTRSEPQNLEAWVALAEASGTNEALFQSALRRARALEPHLPSP